MPIVNHLNVTIYEGKVCLLHNKLSQYETLFFVDKNSDYAKKLQDSSVARYRAPIVMLLHWLKILKAENCEPLLQFKCTHHLYKIREALMLYHNEPIIHNELKAQDFFDVIVKCDDNLVYTAEKLIDNAKISAAKTLLKLKKLSKYVVLFHLVKHELDNAIYPNMAKKILWLDEHNILNEANCAKLMDQKFYYPQFSTHFEFNSFTTNLKCSAQTFFDLMTAQPIENNKDFANAVNELLTSDLGEYIPRVAKSQKPFDFALGLIHLKRGDIKDEKYRVYIEQSTRPDILGKGFCILQEETILKDTAELLCKVPEFAEVFAAAFCKLKKNNCYSIEVCLILHKYVLDHVKNDIILAEALVSVFCILHQNQLAKPQYLSWFVRRLKEEYNLKLPVRLSRITAVATDFCNLFQTRLLTSEEIKDMFEKHINLTANRWPNFKLVVQELTLFSEARLLTDLYKKECCAFLFTIYFPQLSDPNFPSNFSLALFILKLKATKIFDDAPGLGEENFKLFIAVEKEQISALIMTMRAMQKLELFSGIKGQENCNALLKLLKNYPSLFNTVAFKIPSIQNTQQDFDRLLAREAYIFTQSRNRSRMFGGIELLFKDGVDAIIQEADQLFPSCSSLTL